MAVYVLHDDAVVVQTLLDFLSELGYSAMPAYSIHELLSALRSGAQRPDTVIAKQEMLGAACVATLRELHELHPDLAFLLVTSSGSVTAAEAISCGVYTYLRPPIRLSELELSLARLSESRLVEG